MLLGLKISEHYGKNNEYANLYDKLFHQTQEYALEYLQDEELKFFVETTGWNGRKYFGRFRATCEITA